ncbi:MAG: 16S rRNA processing protein RimM [Chloroflexi bacterium]|nr:16S rRNA processing protein RimM [Chloroflexota bacterium]
MAADSDQLTPADAPPASETGIAAAEPAPGLPPSSADEVFLIVARVVRAHGTQGELACEIITEFPQRFRRTPRVYLSAPRGPGRMEPLAEVAPKPYDVTQARLAQHRGFPEVILKLEGLTDRDEADALRGWLVQVPESESWRLPRGRFYWHQIIGLRVVTAEGEPIGTVAEILETGANDVYVVKGATGGERLIPAVKQHVLEIAPERGEMVVSLIPGM